MSSFALTTPVALLVFNRPETTARVFAAIREARPQQLLVVADGPRANRSDDVQKCAEVRYIVGQVDWPCIVLHNYSESNLGCKMRVSSGLDWVFSQVEEAIILEDDCLPDPSFFRFCQELLERYQNDDSIASIGGTNFQFGLDCAGYSYRFSRYHQIWGWATWKRSWMDYDVQMKSWPTIQNSEWLNTIFKNKMDAIIWKVNFEDVYSGKLDTWDFQWTFACWANERLSIHPNINLVSNIGFGREATHTMDSKCKMSNMQTESMEYPLIHPVVISRNIGADDVTQKTSFRKGLLRYLTVYLIQLIKKVVNR